MFSLRLHITFDNALDWLTTIFIPTQKTIQKQGFCQHILSIYNSNILTLNQAVNQEMHLCK